MSSDTSLSLGTDSVPTPNPHPPARPFALSPTFLAARSTTIQLSSGVPESRQSALCAEHRFEWLTYRRFNGALHFERHGRRIGP